jgi:drug/metabolite transporter (DMT)-like permease
VRSQPWFVYLLALLAMLFWGMSFIWSTIVFEYYDPITTVFLRLIISTAILWIIIKLWKKNEKIKKEHYKLLLLSSLLNPFLYFIGENFGLKLTSPAISSVIISTIPLFTPIAGIYVLKEKLGKATIAGMIISFFGILIMLIKPDMSMVASPVGIGFLALAIAVAVGYSVLLKRLTTHYSALTIVFTQNFIGIWYFLPLFLLIDFKKFLLVVPDQRLISSLLLLAFFASSLAFVFYTITTKQLGISRANIFTNLIPVFTAIFSFFLIGEKFDTAKLAGIIIVLAGVALSQYKRKMSIVSAYRYITFNKRKET